MRRDQQAKIRVELQVVEDFEVARETRRRIDFLAGYLQETGLEGYVLGISGGLDSTVSGRLAQLACQQVREAGGKATFVAMRLPYHVQRDEADAQRALAFIDPDELVTLNVGPATDALWDSLLETGALAKASEFVKGSGRARRGGVAQFAVAGARNMLVIGTDQAAEALVGFFTKFGDGAADLTPLTGLPKRRVREIAVHLGAPALLVDKVPTADLESDKPLLPDEAALGVRYQAIDDYLEGGAVSHEDESTILSWHRRTAHKRALPVTPNDWWARSR